MTTLTKKAKIESLAGTVRALQTGEYYTVQYNRPYGDWAYRCFRSAKAAAQFILTPDPHVKNVSQTIDICKDGRKV